MLDRTPLSRVPGELIRDLSFYADDSISGQASRDACISLLATTNDPFNRLQFDPGHFTAGAWVLDPICACVLLVEHEKLGCLVQPGGHPEKGEIDLYQVASREVFEEAGEISLLVSPRTIFDISIEFCVAKGQTPVHSDYDIRYLVLSDSRAPLPSNTGNHRTEWIPLHKVRSRTQDLSVINMLNKTEASLDSLVLLVELSKLCRPIKSF